MIIDDILAQVLRNQMTIMQALSQVATVDALEQMSDRSIETRKLAEEMAKDQP